jgi:hypothetical protein
MKKILYLLAVVLVLTLLVAVDGVAFARGGGGGGRPGAGTFGGFGPSGAGQTGQDGARAQNPAGALAQNRVQQRQAARHRVSRGVQQQANQALLSRARAQANAPGAGR